MLVIINNQMIQLRLAMLLVKLGKDPIQLRLEILKDFQVEQQAEKKINLLIHYLLILYVWSNK